MAATKKIFRIALQLYLLLLAPCSSWTTRARLASKPSTCCQAHFFDSGKPEEPSSLDRRYLFQQLIAYPAVVTAGLIASPALAATSSTESASVTDKIFVEIKGLGGPSSTETKRIVIGLFGKDAPACTEKLKMLTSSQGLPASCRPKAERALQKEQLEANKVYNSCVESESTGVSLKYSTIWRVLKNERIDMGAVTGRFVARDYPNWQESSESGLKHDAPGVVSVRRGSDGGFGFTIYPGSGKDMEVLDEDHIVVGKVLEGMDVVQELNEVPVITSSKVNYMGLTGGTTTKNAPTRACRYGGPMYCNEFKPLIKLSISDVGVV